MSWAGIPVETSGVTVGASAPSVRTSVPPLTGVAAREAPGDSDKAAAASATLGYPTSLRRSVPVVRTPVAAIAVLPFDSRVMARLSAAAQRARDPAVASLARSARRGAGSPLGAVGVNFRVGPGSSVLSREKLMTSIYNRIIDHPGAWTSARMPGKEAFTYRLSE